MRRGRGVDNPYTPFIIPDPLPETELIELVQKLRNNTATRKDIETIFFGHMRLAIALACRIGFTARHIISDAVQEAMLALAQGIKRAPTVLVDDNITPYLSTIMKGAIIDYIESQHLMPARTYRHKKAHDPDFISPLLDFLGDYQARLEDHESSILEILETIETCIKADDNLVRREYKRAIVRLKSAGYTPNEVADILEIKPNYVIKLLGDLYDRYKKTDKGIINHSRRFSRSKVKGKQRSTLPFEKLIDDANTITENEE